MFLHKENDVDEDKIKNDKQKYRGTEGSSFPFDIKDIDPEINSELLEHFPGERTGFVQVGPKKWCFPSGYVKQAENLYNFEFRTDDVVIVTFPRSGTTLTQEMIWLLCNDLNYQKASDILLTERFPFLEHSILIHPVTKQEFLRENMDDPEKYAKVQELDYPGWKKLANLPGQRFIKTHLPFSLLSPNITKVGCKIIYVARNPKDVAVSFYHLQSLTRITGYKGDFRKYWNYFENSLIEWTPYWEHLKEGWCRRHEKNMLFLFYEDIIKNLKSTIGKVATFLDKSYTTEELELLENHLKFENFKENKSVNRQFSTLLGIHLKSREGYIRKGKTGGSSSYFDEDLEKRADQWIEMNLKDTDLKFPV